MKNYVLAFICVAGGLASGCLDIEINEDYLNCLQAGGTPQKDENDEYKCKDDNCSKAGGTFKKDENDEYKCINENCKNAGGTFRKDENDEYKCKDDNCSKAGGTFDWTKNQCIGDYCSNAGGTFDWTKNQCIGDYCSNAGGTFDWRTDQCIGDYCTKAGGTFDWRNDQCIGDNCSKADGTFDWTKNQCIDDNCNKVDEILDLATGECKKREQMNETQFQKLIQDCKTNDGKIKGLTITLTEDVELNAEDFGKCDLVNSTILGSKDSSIITITVPENAEIKDALFKNIKNSTIKNIKFDYDVNYENIEIEWNGASVDDAFDGKGIIAHKISNSELSEIEILGNLSLENIEYNEKNIGGIAGVVQNSTLENVKYSGRISLKTPETGLISKGFRYIYNVGGLIGQCAGKCNITGANVQSISVSGTEQDLIYIEANNSNNNSNSSDKATWPDSIRNTDRIQNVGGLVGYFRNLEDTFESSNINNNTVYGTIKIVGTEFLDSENKSYYNPCAVYNVGGQFGSIKTYYAKETKRLANISDSEFIGCIELGSKDSGIIGASTASGIGGFAGSAQGSIMTKVSAKNPENSKTCLVFGVDVNTSCVDNTASDASNPEDHSAIKIGGLVGSLSDAIISNSWTSMDLRLKGQYLNRIGGVLGAAWMSFVGKSQEDNEEENKITNIDPATDGDDTFDIELFITPSNANTKEICSPQEETASKRYNIKYFGGFVGKAGKSEFGNYTNNVSLKVNSCKDVTCKEKETWESNNKDDKDINTCIVRHQHIDWNFGENIPSP